ncbi:hypothetical protein K461DRAFT_289045 [Myriangium duriaei CBS 260.36]|uniref:Increased recombination centers protein 6 n=1 Tax=Myriangium duriaei CBS 260.36 TaxID=1168546 RepID=A0A9P4JCT3_9PEZI|nr:hypothetical protein K461DRAFT_289045 [Myriangium duriaei CBS 260.36]
MNIKRYNSTFTSRRVHINILFSSMKTVQHPRRLLIVGKPDCDIAGFVTRLTGDSPVKNADGSVAGSIHEWSLKTKYYSANVPVWIDEIVNVATWKDEFSQPEASEVIEAVGGWIYCFDKSAASPHENHATDDTKAAIEAIDSVIQKACGYSWDGLKLVVALSPAGKNPAATTYQNEELDDFAVDHGFELVDADTAGKDDFGEQQGLARIVESVEANDWQPTASAISDDEAMSEQQEMNSELWGMKASLLNGGGDEDDQDEAQLVQGFESLLASAQAVKELGADLPPEERAKLQQRAIVRLVDDAMGPGS